MTVGIVVLVAIFVAVSALSLHEAKRERREWIDEDGKTWPSGGPSRKGDR